MTTLSDILFTVECWNFIIPHVERYHRDIWMTSPTFRKLAMELTWLAHTPFRESFTPSPVCTESDLSFNFIILKYDLYLVVVSHPVDEDIFGKPGVGVLNAAECIHHLPTVQLLHHLL